MGKQHLIKGNKNEIKESDESKPNKLVMLGTTAGGGLLGATIGASLGMLIGGPIGAAIVFLFGIVIGSSVGYKYGIKINNKHND